MQTDHRRLVQTQSAELRVQREGAEHRLFRESAALQEKHVEAGAVVHEGNRTEVMHCLLRFRVECQT